MTTEKDFVRVCHIDDIPEKGARRVEAAFFEIALFRASTGRIFALKNECPHKKGPLSEGIVHGHSVTCPLHGWVINFESGEAEGADSGCTPTLSVKLADDGGVYIALPAPHELETVA